MNVLVISSLNLDMEYSIPRSFIMTFATLSEAKEALKAQSSLLTSLACECVSPQSCKASLQMPVYWSSACEISFIILAVLATTKLLNIRHLNKFY